MKADTKIYLASPFFTEKEIHIYKIIETYLKEHYTNVFIPRDHVIEDGEKMSNITWGQKVFDIDKKGIDECDAVVAINWGMYSDTGTAWEIGYAYGIGKDVYVINITDDDHNRVFSLMSFNGCTENSTLKGFMSGLYEDVEEMNITLK